MNRLQDCFQSEGARQAGLACCDCASWFIRHWREVIPDQPTADKAWYHLKRGEETYLVHKETGKGFSPFRPDRDALKGLYTGLLSIPISIGASVVHLAKGLQAEWETAQNVHALYKTSRQKRDFHWAKFVRMNISHFLPSQKGSCQRAFRDLYCGGATALVGVYSVYNPLDARLYFDQIKSHWFEGVELLTSRQIEALSVPQVISSVFQARIPVYRISGVWMVIEKRQRERLEEKQQIRQALDAVCQGEKSDEGEASELTDSDSEGEGIAGMTPGEPGSGEGELDQSGEVYI